jgi:hypothetical protein
LSARRKLPVGSEGGSPFRADSAQTPVNEKKVFFAAHRFEVRPAAFAGVHFALNRMERLAF